MLFGALAVTIRIAFRNGADADAGAFVTTVGATIVCIVIAAALGQWSRVPWRDTWPFLAAGTVAPGISQLLYTRAVELIGACVQELADSRRDRAGGEERPRIAPRHA